MFCLLAIALCVPNWPIAKSCEPPWAQGPNELDAMHAKRNSKENINESVHNNIYILITFPFFLFMQDCVIRPKVDLLGCVCNIDAACCCHYYNF